MRDELIEFKRERILDVVLELFYLRGFAGTTVDAVAQRLNVTKPFIYSYFKDKNALLVAVYDRATEQLTTGLDEILASNDPPGQQLEKFVNRFARVNMEYRVVATVFFQEEKHLPPQHVKRLRSHQKTFDLKFAALIERGVKAGVFRVEDPQLAALAISGMVRWIQRWYKPGGRLSVDFISSEMAKLALNMVQFSGTDKEFHTVPSRSRVGSGTRQDKVD